ncbi:MAG: type II toxin-antitoxin system RelE/ParE family toxin [Dokdonella sp.]
MKRTPRGAVNQALDRTTRVQRWAAALLTGLLHVMLLLFLMAPPTPIYPTPPAGRAGGSAMEVTLIDESLSLPSPAPPPEPEPPRRKPERPKKPKASRVITPTPVVQAVVPLPSEVADSSDTPNEPPITVDEPPDTAEPPARDWSPPTRMRQDDNARANAALAAQLGSSRGRSNNAVPVGTNMGVDGFHVYYDLFDEDRLRAWRKQGITELFLPMPGSYRIMVCPLEVALRRGSGECRMVEMDSPELKSIGDAREVIEIQRVYHLGEQVWSGPGPYH